MPNEWIARVQQQSKAPGRTNGEKMIFCSMSFMGVFWAASASGVSIAPALKTGRHATPPLTNDRAHASSRSLPGLSRHREVKEDVVLQVDLLQFLLVVPHRLALPGSQLQDQIADHAGHGGDVGG